MPLSADPDLLPVLDVRALNPYDRREVLALWERRVDLDLKNTLGFVFDDEADAYALAMTLSGRRDERAVPR
ncbi:hypothetical protein EFA46_015225 (plasmid) [Halarchaeum sp. CBA1220]|uniref:hypothetical protein n=1 Tax=Halarchaeum sp. CBA1220 TaxID=1853682 RepID=UPI000F3A8EDB|nr:hypothetical protein [Halarchaeum sp. CBA1220]QLC35579.1 hypothetical protein EFA46_015225 [Halarchaeum sp. CBA1220]